MIRSLLTIFAVGIVALNLVAALLPIEQWPLTNAPMFAHYVDEDTPRYAFSIEGVFPNDQSRQLGFYSVGAHWSLMRYFFKYVYGSQDFSSVFAHFSTDDQRSFSARLERFFKAFVDAYYMRFPDAERLSRIDLILNRLAWEDNSIVSQVKVSSFDLDTRTVKLEFAKQ